MIVTEPKSPSTEGEKTADHITVSGDPRVTAVGRILRATKLDEAPELWNVVRGEMALVGPRPDVPLYVDLENRLWQAVLSARPGLTDPATIEQVASAVRTVEVLDLLHALTEADSLATGPSRRRRCC